MKNKNFVDSFNNAINGILTAAKRERNMKIHMITAAVILVVSLACKLTKVEFMIVCLAIGVVFICELINTAIEYLVDIIVDIYHPKAKMVKDIAAGAVLVSAFVSAVIGYFVFFDRMSLGIETCIIWLRQSPVHITMIALVITIILVVFVKTFFKKGTPLHGGMPSGHAAAAFSITTGAALWTGNAKITILFFIMSLLVIQSRLEAGIHNIIEIAAGAIMGFLITLLLFQLF